MASEWGQTNGEAFGLRQFSGAFPSQAPKMKSARGLAQSKSFATVLARDL
jgi:hypothetical protein